jgi:hypothetical protein
VLEQLDRAESLAGPQAARRARQPLPLVTGAPLEQQHLHGAAARPPQREARRHDARVVDDDERLAQLLLEVGEPPVPQLPARAIDDEQPGPVAPVGGMLRDQLLRQLVVQIGDVHARSLNRLLKGRSGRIRRPE